MSKIHFGYTKNNEEVNIYTLKNADRTLKLMDFGATIVEYIVDGISVVGGYDSFESYLEDTSHQGATIGRVANRIANASFTIDGATYNLPKNDHKNCLHGGVGFDRRMWNVVEYTDNSVTFSYMSKDMEEGFPSNLYTEVTYTLSDADLIIEYKSIPDGKTPIALTNHSYFNLNGFGDTIESHRAIIYADRYTEVDSELIPNGNRPYVKGTVFDFTEEKEIGRDIGGDFIGYDHNYILCPDKFIESNGTKLGLAAEVRADRLKMSVYTDQEGVQFYIGKFLKGGPAFHGNVKKIMHGAFCLETQTEPNCINHGIGIYDKGMTYTHKTIYRIEKL